MIIEKYKNCFSFGNKCYRFLWNLIWLFLFRPFPGALFYSWRNFLLRLFGAKIGIRCRIRCTVKVWMPANLIIGDAVAIGQHVELYNVAPITIGDGVTVSQYSFLCTASHDIFSRQKTLICIPITLASFSWIAADAFIGMGVTIGEGAVVGARACVFRNVEPWTVVGGNPTKFIKKREIKE